MAASRAFVLHLLISAVVVNAQYYDYTTPVPILKQINRHNDDGSYSYGYEAADGSYKIETKHNTGEVVGKYGYVDDAGSVREVEYGASRRGFEPAGTGINVAPPTLKRDNNYRPNSVGEDYDDGQYREDPSVYYKNPSYNSAPERSFSNNNYNPPQQSYNPPQQSYNPPQQSYNPPQQSYHSQPSYNSQPSYESNYDSYNPPAHSPPQSYYNQPQQQHQQQPYYPKVDPSQFRGHPASNFDVYSGSYSVNYSGRS